MKSANCFVFTLFIFSFFLLSEDWVNRRGPREDGICNETHWNLKITKESMKVLWQKEVGNGHSAVVVYGNCLYTMGNIKNQDIVYCFDAQTGEEKWKHSYPCKAGSFPGPRSTPTTDGENVYTYSRNGDVFCLDARTGAVKWSKNIVDEWKVTNLMHGISGSPRIFGDVLLLNAGNYGFAFNKKTGEKIWNSDPEKDCGYATPVAFPQGSLEKSLVFAGDGLSYVEVKTGKVIFFFPWKTIYALNASDPVISDNFVLLCSYHEKGSTLIEIQEEKPKVVWDSLDLQSSFSTPVIVDGHIYGFKGSAGEKSIFRCVELKTGKEKWSKSFVYACITAVGNKLLVLDELGKLFVVKASPDGYEEISCCPVFALTKDMRAWTVPILCDGKLYLRNNMGNLLCIELEKI
ncbi:MAG: PQQ-binding-like beta-propeller repeat protein [Candidatus Brocadiae bacterium]|nr:PQQ-binding-like beta-propeller repeat protein [Candidatus Brocadiia bacterium]